MGGDVGKQRLQGGKNENGYGQLENHQVRTGSCVVLTLSWGGGEGEWSSELPLSSGPAQNQAICVLWCLLLLSHSIPPSLLLGKSFS